MIADSSPLIFLAKLNRLDLLKALFSKVIIPVGVKKEVWIADKPGFSALSHALDAGWLAVEDPKAMLPLGLGAGEDAALSLAKERKDTLIVDDAYAINAARALGISTLRTTSVIFLSLKKKVLRKEEALALLNRLIDSGYYIAPRYYIALAAGLREFSRK